MGIIAKPVTFVDNTVPTAAQFNSDFDTLYSEFNGNITNANINASAAIAESKVAFLATGHGHTGGSDGKTISLTSKIGTFTRDMLAATGTVAYTGVGFQPSLVLFFAVQGGNFLGIGSVKSSEQAAFYHADSYTSGLLNSTYAIYLSNSSGADQHATLSSLDADGFTLSWTKVGTPTAGTADIIYIAFK